MVSFKKKKKKKDAKGKEEAEEVEEEVKEEEEKEVEEEEEETRVCPAVVRKLCCSQSMWKLCVSKLVIRCTSVINQ